MKAKKTNSEKKSQEADFLFPFGDFRKMAEMMKKCCPGDSGAIGCCSMMGRMMGRGKGGGGRKKQETQESPRGGEKV